MSFVPTPLKRACTTISRGSAPTYAPAGDPGIAVVIGQSCQRPDGSFDVSFARRQASEAGVPSKGAVHGGEVLINSTGTGTLGRVAMLRDQVTEPTFVDSHVTVLRVDPRRTDARFLAAVLGLPTNRTFIEKALSVGATKQRELAVEALRSHVLPLPTLTLQREIADFVDRERERIAALESRSRRLAARVREWEQSALAQAFETSTTAPPNTLRRVLVASPSYGVLVPRFDAEEGVPFIRVGDLTSLGGTPLARIESAQSDEYRRTVVEPGDVLVSVVGSIDKAAVVPTDCAGANVARAVARLRPIPSVPPVVLLAWTRTAAYRAQALAATSSDTAQPTLNMSDLAAFKLRIPTDPSGCGELATKADSIMGKARQIVATNGSLRNHLTEYRDALIAEAVTGKLDVTKLSDAQLEESAHAAVEGETAEVLAS